MIVSVVEELLHVVFPRQRELDEVGAAEIGGAVIEAAVADGDAAAVLGDVRDQDEELKSSLA